MSKKNSDDKEEGKKARLTLGGVDMENADEEDVFAALVPSSLKDPSNSELFVLLTDTRAGKPTVIERRVGSIKNLAQLLLDNGIRGSNLFSKLLQIKNNSYVFAGQHISEGLIDDLLDILRPLQQQATQLQQVQQFTGPTDNDLQEAAAVFEGLLRDYDKAEDSKKQSRAGLAAQWRQALKELRAMAASPVQPPQGHNVAKYMEMASESLQGEWKQPDLLAKAQLLAQVHRAPVLGGPIGRMEQMIAALYKDFIEREALRASLLPKAEALLKKPAGGVKDSVVSKIRKLPDDLSSEIFSFFDLPTYAALSAVCLRDRHHCRHIEFPADVLPILKKEPSKEEVKLVSGREGNRSADVIETVNMLVEVPLCAGFKNRLARSLRAHHFTGYLRFSAIAGNGRQLVEVCLQGPQDKIGRVVDACISSADASAKVLDRRVLNGVSRCYSKLTIGLTPQKVLEALRARQQESRQRAGDEDAAEGESISGGDEKQQPPQTVTLANLHSFPHSQAEDKLSTASSDPDKRHMQMEIENQQEMSALFVQFLFRSAQQPNQASQGEIPVDPQPSTLGLQGQAASPSQLKPSALPQAVGQQVNSLQPGAGSATTSPLDSAVASGQGSPAPSNDQQGLGKRGLAAKGKKQERCIVM